jgi:hypothetical protein
MANRSFDGRVSGVAYTDSGSLEVAKDGRFAHVRVHNHCSASGGCCRLDGSTERGTLSLEGPRLVFAVQSGTQMVKDDCAPAIRTETAVPPRVERVTWSLRPNPAQRNEITLCWSTTSGEAVCYARQE